MPHTFTRISIRNVDPEYALACLFKKWATLPAHERKTSLLGTYVSVTYQGQEGTGPGVARSFLQRLADELKIYNVFTPSTGEPTERYFINPMFVPDERFKVNSGKTFDQEAHYVLFYTFIGHLIGFLLVNRLGLRTRLSYSIIAHMLYKDEEILDDDYVSYAFVDFPTEFNTYINLMKNPSQIEESLLSFNSLYNIRAVGRDEDITIANFKAYLRELYKYRYTRNPFAPTQQPDAPPDINQRFKGFLTGLKNTRKLLRSVDMRISIPMLDKLLTAQGISEAILHEFIRSFELTMSRRIDPEYQSLKDNMVYILRDFGETFPYEIRGIERPATSEGRRTEFFKFIENLLMFWSSVRRYMPGASYSMNIVAPEDTSAGRRILQGRRPLTPDERMNMLPESHTCFTTIDIPNTYHDDRDKLYQKLVQATDMVEAGIGNYGGSKKRASSRKK